MENKNWMIKADHITNGIAVYMAENTYLNDTALDVLKMVAKWIEEAQTVNAVEVIHGRWDVEVGMNYNRERICPVCKKHIESNFWNYCSNCGARMDLED